MHYAKENCCGLHVLSPFVGSDILNMHIWTTWKNKRCHYLEDGAHTRDKPLDKLLFKKKIHVTYMRCLCITFLRMAVSFGRYKTCNKSTLRKLHKLWHQLIISWTMVKVVQLSSLIRKSNVAFKIWWMLRVYFMFRENNSAYFHEYSILNKFPLQGFNVIKRKDDGIHDSSFPFRQSDLPLLWWPKLCSLVAQWLRVQFQTGPCQRL